MLKEFLRRPLLWVLLYGALLAYGIFALLHIPVEILPQFDIPEISVIAHLPGATTEDLEALIARPVESSLFSLNGLSNVRTAISQGTVEINARFVSGTRPEIALQEVNGALNQVRLELPQAATISAEIAGNAINEVADYAIRLPPETSPPAVQRVLETMIAPGIRALPGVQKVLVYGPGSDAVWIQIDPARMQSLDVSPAAAEQAVKAAIALSPSGYLSQGHQDVFISGRSLPVRPNQFSTIQVASPHGPVPLAAIARIVRAPVPSHSAVLLDDAPTVALTVFKQPGASTVAVTHAVRRELAQWQSQLPGDATFVRIYNQGHLVSIIGSDLGKNLALGALLAIAVLFWLLGAGRGVWALALSIPLSLLLGIAGLYMANQSLNLLTLGALSVAVGLLADDAIIVLESIHYRWEQGDGRWDGVWQGLRDIAGPDVSGTLTTVSVFVPLLFVGSLAGLFFVPFSLAMTLALLASLFISLTLIPLLLGMLGPAPARPGHSGARALAWLKRANLTVFDIALAYPGRALAGCIVFFVASIGALLLIPVNFLPLPNEAVLLESFTLPPGTSLADTRQVVATMTRHLQSMKEVDHVFARIGSAAGTAYTEPAFAGEIQVTLKPGVGAGSLDRISEEITRKTKMPGVQTSIDTPTVERVGESLSGLPQPFVIDVYGTSLDTLRKLSNQVTRRLASVHRLSDVFNNDGYPVTELQIRPKPAALATYQISPAELNGQIKILLGGKVLANVPDGNGTMSIYMRTADPAYLSLDALRNMPIKAHGWTTLGELATIGFDTSPNTIRHLDGIRAIEILATPQAPLGQVISEARRALATLKLPPGYRIRFGGLYPQLEQAAVHLALAAIAAFCLMIGIFALQFDGFLVPGLLLVQIPLAFSGGAAALAISGVGLNAIGLVALLTLIGISLNHGIVLLHRVRRNEARGLDVREAVKEAVNVRFRPILLTTLTAALGMLPTALGLGKGAAPEQGLAVVTLGGIIWSALLSTNLLPALYVRQRTTRSRPAQPGK